MSFSCARVPTSGDQRGPVAMEMVMVQHALDVLVEQVPTLLAGRGFDPDVCILATRIACLALSEVGVKASPLPVRFDGFSPAYVQAVKDDRIGVDAVPTSEHHEALLAEGAWHVIIGDPENEGKPRPNGRPGFNAHLTALVERRHVVDLTIHQASRPSKDMIFTPHHFRVTPEFMAGESMTFETKGGAIALYRRIEKNTYTVAPDWTMVRRDDPLVKATVKRLRGQRRAA